MHVPVLADAAVEWLRIRATGVYVDCTAGAGGHSVRIASLLRGGRLIALDRDPTAVERVRSCLAEFAGTTVVQRNYGDLGVVLNELKIEEVDGVLFDVGVSSMQIDMPDRGFSFQADGPLDMRMDTSQPVTAASLLASLDAESLAHLLSEYGDVRPSRRIARAIIKRSESGALQTTRDLVEAVMEALPFVHGVPEEVRRVFQAVRIAVNEEFQALERGITAAMESVNVGGRVVCISFHSGEDRIVKRLFQEASRTRRALHADGRVKEVLPPRMQVLTRRPVVPDDEEVRVNPRAHSAKLRVVERIV